MAAAQRAGIGLAGLSAVRVALPPRSLESGARRSPVLTQHPPKSMPKPNDDLLDDPLLQSAPLLEGFTVLDPAVLYAKSEQPTMPQAESPLAPPPLPSALPPLPPVVDPARAKRTQPSASVRGAAMLPVVLSVLLLVTLVGVGYGYSRGWFASKRGSPPAGGGVSASLDWADPVRDAGTVMVDGKQYPRIVVEKQTGMRMVLIPAKSDGFQMGSPDSEPDHESNETQHRRVIGKAFWLGETEVTQAQWQKVMWFNRSKFKGDELPVEQVSWNDCQQFVQKLNQRGTGFRLPSEAEWEYACRAGSVGPFSFGANITTAQVNCNGRYPYNGAAEGQDREKTVPVRGLPANAFGLYEMHGNVLEWCEDTYDNYPGTGTEEPTRGEGLRVSRGGCWVCDARSCRSAFRRPYDPADLFFVGLRLARTLQ